jgi:hypothetical protein
MAFGPAATSNYAGSIWISHGVLYASQFEFSGNFKGAISPDGSMFLQTKPYPDRPNTVRAHITARHGGTFLLAGTYTSNLYGNCIVHNVITSGHIRI